MLKGLFHPACLAFVVLWPMKMATNKGQPKDEKCKECWMKETFETKSLVVTLVVSATD